MKKDSIILNQRTKKEIRANIRSDKMIFIIFDCFFIIHTDLNRRKFVESHRGVPQDN